MTKASFPKDDFSLGIIDNVGVEGSGDSEDRIRSCKVIKNMVINARKTLDKRGPLALRNYRYTGTDEKTAQVPLTSNEVFRTATLLFSLEEKYLFLFTAKRVHLYNMSDESIGTVVMNVSSRIRFDRMFADSFYSAVEGGTMVITGIGIPPLSLSRISPNNFVLSAITFISPPIITASTADEVKTNEKNKTEKLKFVSPIAFGETSGKSKFYISVNNTPSPQEIQKTFPPGRYQVKFPETVTVSDSFSEEQLSGLLVSEMRVFSEGSRILEYDIIPRKDKIAWKTPRSSTDYSTDWLPPIFDKKPLGFDEKTFNPAPTAIDKSFGIDDSSLVREKKIQMIPVDKAALDAMKSFYEGTELFFATTPVMGPTARGFYNDTQQLTPKMSPLDVYLDVQSTPWTHPLKKLEVNTEPVELDVKIDKIQTVNDGTGKKVVFSTFSYNSSYALPVDIHPSKSNPFAVTVPDGSSKIFRLTTFLDVKVTISVKMALQFSEGKMVISLLSIYDDLPNSAGVADYKDVKPALCTFTLDDDTDAKYVGSEGLVDTFFYRPMDVPNEGTSSTLLTSFWVMTYRFPRGGDTLVDMRDGTNYSSMNDSANIATRSSMILTSISKEVKNTFERFRLNNPLPVHLPLSESVPATSEARNSNRTGKAINVSLNYFKYFVDQPTGLLYQDIELPFDGVFRITSFNTTSDGSGYFLKTPTPDISNSLKDLKDKNKSNPSEGDDPDLITKFGAQIKGKSLSAFVNTPISVTTVNRLAWNATDGYPSVCAFYQARLFLASTKTQGAYLWASQVGDYYNYDNGSGRDNEGFDFVVNSDGFGAIQHLVVGNSLIVLTVYEEYYVRTDNQEPITPATMNVMRVSGYGSAKAKPTFIDGSIVFIDRNSHSFISIQKNENGYSMSSRKLNIPVPRSGEKSKNIIKMELVKPRVSTESEKIYVLTDDNEVFVFNFESSAGISGWTSIETNGKFFGICGVDNALMTIVQRDEGAYGIVYNNDVISSSKEAPMYKDCLASLSLSTVSPFDFIYTFVSSTETDSGYRASYSIEKLMPEEGRNLDFRIPVPAAYPGTHESIVKSKVRLNSQPDLSSPVFITASGGGDELNLKSNSYWGYLYETEVVLHPLYRNFGAYDTFDKIIKLSVGYFSVSASGVIDVYVDGKLSCRLYSETERSINIAEAKKITSIRSGFLFSELTTRTVVSLKQTDVGSFSLLKVSVDGTI